MEKKTDKNQIIGLVLIGLILIGFSWYNATYLSPEEAPVEVVAEKPADLPTAAAITQPELRPAPTDSNAVTFAETRHTLENDQIKMEFSTKGGMPVRAYLKEFKTYQDFSSGTEQPLTMIDENGYFAARLGNIQTGELNYQPSQNGNTLTMEAQTPEGAMVKWVYQLSDTGYDLNIQLEANGLTESGEKPTIIWNQIAMRHEKSLKTENMSTQVYYYRDNDYHTLSAGGSASKDKDQVKWVAYKQQFFSAILKFEDGFFDQAQMKSEQIEGDERFTKAFGSNLTAGTIQNGAYQARFSMFIGPNKHDILKDYEYDYYQIIDFGWGIFGWIGRGVIVRFFDWLDAYHLNYGIIILIMALAIKLVLLPFMFSSYKSMAKMRVLKPEMDEITEKYKDKDPMKKQQAVMELYQKAGVNPLAGCLPQLVQLPILIAMFRFFPASIELRQQKFLWADDLSSFDVIYAWDTYVPLLSDFYGNHISLFTVLMAISTLAYTMLNNQLQGTNTQFPQLKYIMYLMPVMLLFWFNSYASGLSYYYFIANITTFAQQFGIRGLIDEDAIHAKIQENKSKPKKKSRFAAALEAQMEKQKEAAPMNRRMKRNTDKN